MTPKTGVDSRRADSVHRHYCTVCYRLCTENACVPIRYTGIKFSAACVLIRYTGRCLCTDSVHRHFRYTGGNRYLPETDVNEQFGTMKDYVQTFLFPCFQRPEAIYKYKKKQIDEVLQEPQRPCCSCSITNKCIQSTSCECKAKGELCTVSCQAKNCRNTTEGKKLQKADRKNNPQNNANTSTTSKGQEKATECVVCAPSEVQGVVEDQVQANVGNNDEDGVDGKEDSEGKVRGTMSNYAQPETTLLKTGDVLIIPGGGEKGLLHHGVKRMDKVQVSFSCCPKVPKIPHYSNSVSGRAHTQFLVLMEKCWHEFPSNKKFPMRLNLLHWFSVYLCLALCGGRKVSDELAAYKNLHPIIVEMQEELFGFGDGPTPDESEGSEDDSDEDSPEEKKKIIKLPTNGKLCFNPHSIPKHDYSSGDAEPEYEYRMTAEFEDACTRVLHYLNVVKKCHKNNNLLDTE